MVSSSELTKTTISPMNVDTTTAGSDTLPDESTKIERWTWALLILYLVAIGINLRTVLKIRKINFNPPIAPIDVVYVDCGVSTAFLLGFVAVLWSSIADHPNPYLCSLANFGAMVSFGWPIVSGLFLAYLGHNRRVLQGQPAEQILQAEDEILVTYQFGFFMFVCFNFAFSVINYSQDWQIYPPLEFCIRSGVVTNALKFCTCFLLPFATMSISTLFISTISLQFSNLNQFFHCLSQMKSSIFTSLLLLASMPSVLNGLGIIEVSQTIESLLDMSLFWFFVALKGPLLLHWYLDTEGQQADDQVPEEFEMQNV